MVIVWYMILFVAFNMGIIRKHQYWALHNHYTRLKNNNRSVSYLSIQKDGYLGSQKNGYTISIQYEVHHNGCVDKL